MQVCNFNLFIGVMYYHVINIFQYKFIIYISKNLNYNLQHVLKCLEYQPYIILFHSIKCVEGEKI